MAKGKKGKGKEPAEEPASEEEVWEDDAPKKGGKKALDKAAKRAEELEKKKQREELLKMEEESIPSKKGGNAKKAGQRRGNIDDALNSFSNPNNKKATISASGIDDAIGALSLLSKDGEEIDRHPERRVKAALAAYSERRLPEIKAENPGLRKQQLEQLVYKEFQKSSENPMNQVSAKYNAKQDDLDELRQNIRKGKEMKYQR